jgi:hypothetical protein
MTDSANNNDRYNRLLLESIGKLSGQTEELNHRYAALDKTICLLKQAYEASLQADHQVMADLLAQVRRITTIVEDLGCQEHARRLHDFQHWIASLEAYVIPSKCATRFIAAFFQKTGWIFGALIIGSIGYAIYCVAVKIVQP